MKSFLFSLFLVATFCGAMLFGQEQPNSSLESLHSINLGWHNLGSAAAYSYEHRLNNQYTLSGELRYGLMKADAYTFHYFRFDDSARYYYNRKKDLRTDVRWRKMLENLFRHQLYMV